jgi:hypothetical protein
MVAIGFGASQSIAGGHKVWVCHDEAHKSRDGVGDGEWHLVQVTMSSLSAHQAHGDYEAELIQGVPTPCGQET